MLGVCVYMSVRVRCMCVCEGVRVYKCMCVCEW